MHDRIDSRAAQRIRVAGVDISVRRKGRGRQVVCLHAIGHDSRDYDPLADRLGGEFEFLLVDWPGHGASGADGLPLSVARYGDILNALLDALQLHRPILIGNSIGGGAAIRTAAKRPAAISGLVVCNSSGLVAPNLIVRLACRRMARRFAGCAADPAGFARWYRQFYEGTVLPDGPAVRREEIIAAGEARAAYLQQAWLGFSHPDNDLRHLAARVECPTLVAWARGDRVNPWRFSKAGAGRFPISETVLLKGGHTPFLEDPDGFDAAFRQFANRVGSD